MKPSYSPVNRKSEPGEEPGEFQGEGVPCQLQIPFVQRLSSRPFSSHFSGTVRPGFDEPYIRHQLMTHHNLPHSDKSVAQSRSAAVVTIFQSPLVSRSDLLVMNTQAFWGTDQFTRAGGEVLAQHPGHVPNRELAERPKALSSLQALRSRPRHRARLCPSIVDLNLAANITKMSADRTLIGCMAIAGQCNILCQISIPSARALANRWRLLVQAGRPTARLFQSHASVVGSWSGRSLLDDIRSQCPGSQENTASGETLVCPTLLPRIPVVRAMFCPSLAAMLAGEEAVDGPEC